ncbi:AfsR/SARP family transcriptional regulator [Kitasatospora terrestris]|uniref:OmpR/PhoB-type domain-containing protein n=1 Tax=Kitasatospora terrestris TaxID=258051 RepID=A0ABP9DGW3_9ACTN
MPITFGVLGPLTVHDGREPRPITSPTHRLLLTHLLLNAGRAVTADALLTLVWGERPPRTAAASLHNHVGRLRRALGPRLEDRLAATGGGYRLRVEDGELDSAVFAGHLGRARAAHTGQEWTAVALETAAALELWRGGPPEDSAAVGPAEAARLAELRLQALEWRFDAELALGRHHGLAAELALLTAEHPLRESFHRQLMLALWRGGRRADALAVYRTLRGTLVEELGLEPGTAIQLTHREILADEPRPAAGRGDGGGTADRRGADAGSVGGRDGRERTEAGGGERTEAGAGGKAADGTAPDGSAAREGAADGGAADDGAAAAVATPSQLPLAPGDFTGRQGELDALALYLRPGEPGGPARVVLVTGMGGVGKTSLVLHGAHAAAEDFPDGRLYADLRGFGVCEARTPHDLLGRFLADLGVAGEALPKDTDDRAALYRSLLAERRVLVVLDNARDGRQVAPLLPGSGRSAVVVTSRHKLSGVQCTARIPLGPLSAPEQRALLAAMCGADRVAADPVAAGQVMAACAGLPLALRIAGSRLAHRPTWRLSELARRLNRTDRLQALAVDHLAVREAFSFSYTSLLAGGRPLEQEAARAFRLLGLWPAHHHSAESVAALLGAPVDDALDVLDTLVDAHLLDVSAPGRYRFHDLLGEFAAERVLAEEPEQARAEALVRLLGWYTSAVAAANLAIAPLALPIPAVEGVSADWELFELPEYADEEAALEWCGEELAAIRDAVRRAAALDRPDLSWRLAAALFGYGLTYWWNGEWAECLYEALEATAAADDPAGQAWLHGRLGVAHGLTRAVEPCIEHLEKAYGFFRTIDDLAAQKAVVSNLSAAYSQAGDTERAQEWATRAMALAERLAVQPDAARLASLGDLRFRQGDLPGAEQSYREAIAEWRRLDSRSQLSLALYNLGDTLRAQGRARDAVAPLLESLEIRRELGSHGNVADTLETLARTHFEGGDPEAARQYWSQALTLARRHRLEHFIGLSERGLAGLAS